MPCSIYARQTGAVPSGRSVSERPRAVLERVHLLADDVGRLADRAHEQLRVLEDGRLDLAEAGALGQGARLLDDPPAERRLLGQQVVGPARNLKARSHRLTVLRRRPSGTSGGELGKKRVRAALGTEARDAHVPGIDGRVLRKRLDQRPDRARAASPSRRRAGRRGRPTPGRGRRRRRSPLGRDRVREVAGAVAGREQDVDLEARELEPLSALQRVVGLVALVWAESRRTARSS